LTLALFRLTRFLRQISKCSTGRGVKRSWRTVEHFRHAYTLLVGLSPGFGSGIWLGASKPFAPLGSLAIFWARVGLLDPIAGRQTRRSLSAERTGPKRLLQSLAQDGGLLSVNDGEWQRSRCRRDALPPRLAVPRPRAAACRRCRRRGRGRGIAKIGRIKVVLAGNADEREQDVAAGIGQRRPHAAGAGHLGNGADRPVRGDPLARRQQGRESH
jgi:hypothetical protein